MADINDIVARFEAFIAETYPDADIAPGSVLSELLVKSAAQVHLEITESDIEALGNTKSVTEVLESATDTYSEIIDKLASNYNVTRNSGQKVTGHIKVVVAENRSFFIEKGFMFQQPLLKFNYITTQDFTVIQPGLIPSSSSEIKLISDSGTFYFVVPVEAEDVGVEVHDSVVPNRTPFAVSSTNSQIQTMVRAEAYGNFSGGRNKETDRELITRFKEGMSYKGLTSPTAMAAVFRDNFVNFKTLSVVGSNDSELVRAKNNIFGISTLGMSDVYVRTSNTVQTTAITLTGTKVNSTTWKIEVPANWSNPAVPAGAYRIISIAPQDIGYGGSYAITKITYGYQKPAIGRSNHITTAIDARYTKYQTCTVEFACAETATSKIFNVSFAYMPEVDTIQDYILDDDNRIASADYLVKAIVPCHVTMSLRLYRKDPLIELPEVSIKRDIFNYINNIAMGEDLIVSSIVDICHNYKIKRVDLPLLVTGTIWAPNTIKDESLIIKSDDVLALPDYPDKGISKKTTAFFTSYFDDNGTENIGIEQV